MPKHSSHITRFSLDASTYDEVCLNCENTDMVPGGWGELAKPCPLPAIPLKVEICKVNLPDKNNEIYQHWFLENEIKRLKKPINSQSLFGTFGAMKSFCPWEASHLITKLSIEDERFIAELGVLHTRTGKILNTIINAGFEVFFRLAVNKGDTYKLENIFAESICTPKGAIIEITETIRNLLLNQKVIDKETVMNVFH